MGRTPPFLVVVLSAALLTGCRGLAAVFFDLPPSSPPPSALGVQTASAVDLASDTTLLIERSLDPEVVLSQIPTDNAGNVDWAAALREGIISPRNGAGGARVGNEPGKFGFDFFLPGEMEMFDAFFPHSSHVAWMDCDGCHGPVVKYRDTDMSMEAINAGRECGVCHGSVAFPASTCERCHAQMTMPEGRNPTEFLGTVRMARTIDSTGIAVQATGSTPPSIFPHWVHRIRYTCSTCHPDPFAMEVGSTTVTMAQLQEEESCGQCHTGREAFGLVSCNRCHVAEDPPAPQGG